MKQCKMFLSWARWLLEGQPGWHPILNSWETLEVPVDSTAHRGRQVGVVGGLDGPSCISLCIGTFFFGCILV
jgi:hypothetical protein